MSSTNPDEDRSSVHAGVVVAVGLLASLYALMGRDGAVLAWAAVFISLVAWIAKENYPRLKGIGTLNPNKEIIRIEQAVIGRQERYWHGERTGIWVTWIVTAVFSLYAATLFLSNQHLAIEEGATDPESWAFATLSSLSTAFFYWIITLIALKNPRWDLFASNLKSLLGGSGSAGEDDLSAVQFLSSNWGFFLGCLLGYVLSGPLAALAIGLIIQGIVRLPVSSTLGALSGLILMQIVGWLAYFSLVEVQWDVIWANRVLLLVGQLMTESMTQDYFPSQNWRIWLLVYMVWPIVGGIYGTLAEKPGSFLIPFWAFSFVLALVAEHQGFSNYDTDGTLWRLMLASTLASVSFLYCNMYSAYNGEYLANRLKNYLIIASVLVFFSSFVIMDPPESIQKIACDEMIYEYETEEVLDADGLGTGEFVNTTVVSDWECGSAHLQGPMVGDGFAQPGLKPSQWGGLYVNLVVAAAGCVLGFGVGVALAFGRQSNQPFFKVPSVLFIELVRSGPLICWLYFAMYLLPDLVDPTFQDPENFDNMVKMMLIFALFGGCYIAEVLRGGLQSVDSGQKEAAKALGLNPIQSKLLVELPNAVRTTLPSIVSVFIGLWKDTTLLFIINILDFFKLAKDSPNSSLDFLGDFLQPVYLSGLVFWAVAFYLSRISMRIEKNLGLVNEGGGEVT